MTYAVYGLRLIGDTGARYIGQTGGPIEHRLRTHIREARAWGGHNPTRLHAWLNENRGNVEAFTIWRFDTRQEAVAGERTAVEACVALGHDLLNRWLVPGARQRLAA